MMISTKGRYALSTLIDIAEQEKKGEPVSIKEVAERQGISVKYLEQIIALMVKGGFLKSVRGAKGGYISLKGGKGHFRRRYLGCRRRNPLSCRLCERRKFL